MREQRRVLYGADVIENLQIDNSTYRTQVEHELRGKQIRLRQKSAELLGTAGALLKLLSHSISTFCVLGRHALLILSGHAAALQEVGSRRRSGDRFGLQIGFVPIDSGCA